jgi:flagellar basal body-associated protein FliL
MKRTGVYKGEFEMTENAKPSSGSKMHAIILAVIGVILVFAGVGIATIHSSLRGSGLGTISLVIGAVLLVIALLRFNIKRA